jgi:SET domain-containing protein
MQVVETYIGPSRIHGTGVFAKHPIKKGTVISRFMPPMDSQFPHELFLSLTPVEQAYLRNFAYRSKFTKLWVLNGDADRYMNHSSDPNTDMHPDGTSENIALRDIEAGEELTCDYSGFDMDWKNKLGL